MELKTIFYICLGIGWFIYNNYKKIVAENKKRNLNLPPQEVIKPQRKPDPVGSSPPAPKKTFEQKRPTLPEFKTKPNIDRSRQTDGKRAFKRIVKKQEETAVPVTLEQIRDFESPVSSPRLTTDNSTVIERVPVLVTEKKLLNQRSFKMTEKELQRAFILGEVINKPRYENA